MYTSLVTRILMIWGSALYLGVQEVPESSLIAPNSTP